MAVHSANDIFTVSDYLNDTQRKSVIELLDKHAGDPQGALKSIKDYCKGLPKIKVLCVKHNSEENPTQLEIITSSTTYTYRLR